MLSLHRLYWLKLLFTFQELQNPLKYLMHTVKPRSVCTVGRVHSQQYPCTSEMLQLNWWKVWVTVQDTSIIPHLMALLIRLIYLQKCKVLISLHGAKTNLGEMMFKKCGVPHSNIAFFFSRIELLDILNNFMLCFVNRVRQIGVFLKESNCKH